jgi:putative two-component system response regulator
MIEKANILIVDDELGPRESLRMILKPAYNVYTAEDGYQALNILEQQPIDLITLDLRMEGMGGIDVLKEVKEHNKDIGVIIITGFGTLGAITTANQYGVSDFISKPFNVSDVTMVVQKSLGKKKQGSDIRKLLEEIGTLRDISKIDKAKKIFEKSAPFIKELTTKCTSSTNTQITTGNMDCFKFLKLISDILQHKTHAHAEHAERIYYYCTLFFDALQLSAHEKEVIEIAAYFHDIGKMGMEIDFLEGEKYFDEHQYQEWKQHPAIGVAMLAPVDLSPEITTVILHHHERYDGRGYPDSLKGEEIPLGARILRIANAYDAQLIAKPFPEPQSKQNIINNMNSYEAGEADPQLLQIFIKALQIHDKRLQ